MGFQLFKRSLFLNIALAVLCASLIAFFYLQGALTRLELSGLDFLFRLRGNIPFSPRIILIEITDYDILEIGRWPWNRTWHAAMARALKDLEAKCAYFDIIFSEAAVNEQEDLLFEEALKEAKNVFVPFVFQEPTFDMKKALLPLPRFARQLKGTGAINIGTDVDGTLRRAPLFFPAKDGINPHIALEIAMDYLGFEVKQVKSNQLILGNSQETMKVPMVDKNKMLINWSGKWRDTFKHYSFLEVLASYKDFLDKKKPEIDIGSFRNSICIIGVTAIGIYDILPIPLEPEYPAMGVIANTLNNLLNKKFLSSLPEWINILLIFIMALIPAFLIFGEKPLRETMLVFLVGAMFIVINFLLFKRNLKMALSSPLLGLFLSYFTVETYNFVRTSVERKAFFTMSITDGLTGLYNIRYFNMHLESEIMLAKPASGKKFSILMSDIDHFKHFNDTYGHPIGDLVLKEVSSVLKNSVRSSDIVARYGGEEMIILLRGSSLRDSLNVAEKIRKSVENCVVKSFNDSFRVTISLGVSAFQPKDTVYTIIKRADEGLYKAKQSGRNKVCTMEDPELISPA